MSPSSCGSREEYEHQVLVQIEADHDVSQRSLSTRLGIALGLTNIVIRHMVRRGLVRVIQIRPNRVRYLLTPSGLAEKARLSRRLLRDAVQFYSGARERVGESLAAISRDWPAMTGDGAGDKRIVFYGTGQVAEIAYVCLQETDLRLVGVIGDSDRRRFFEFAVVPGDGVQWARLETTPFDRLVVTSFGDSDEVRAQVDALGIPAERVHWL